jgi:branched-chain amino acid transport system ATP-binding protein
MTENTRVIFEARSLEVAYLGGIKVIWGISFDVREKEILSIVGSNGAGKTTTIRTITGLMPAMKGEMIFLDNRINGKSSSEIVNLGIIHIPEGRQLFPQMSVYENLILGCYPKKFRVHQRENLESVLRLFPRLKGRLKQKAGSMSGGEQQMVAIGRGLMAKPKMFIVDELSLGLAPLLVKELFAIIDRINNEGVAVILVEQNVKSALEIAHRAVVMENGRITMAGEAKAVLQDDHIKKAYLGL